MSFGESIFVGGFNQKTIKEGLFIKANHVYPRRNQLGKILDDSRGQTTEDGAHMLAPPRYISSPPP